MAKRRGGEEGHHGGAWKVAYGDFVTAMMALFMLLWILSQNIEVKEQIQQYFLDPFSSNEQRSPGVVSEDHESMQQQVEADPPRPVINQETLWELAKKFYDRLNLDIENEDKPIDISLTDDGLFITLYNRDDQPFFKKNSSELTQWGKFVVEQLSWLIDDAEMPAKIASHIPKGMLSENRDGWSLTTKMSNNVRQTLNRYGLPQESIHRITGYGNSQPINGLSPENSKNHRVEIELTIPGSDKAKSGPTPEPNAETVNNANYMP